MIHASHAIGEPEILEGGITRRTCLKCGARADRRAVAPALDAQDMRLAQPCGVTAGEAELAAWMQEPA